MSVDGGDPPRPPFPFFSCLAAIFGGMGLLALVLLEVLWSPVGTAQQQVYLSAIVLGALIAGLGTMATLVTAWCPIILGGDRRPWIWVVPLVLAWFVFSVRYDWRSLLGPLL